MLPRSDLASTSFSNINMIVFSAKEVPIVLMFILLSCIWTLSEAGVYDRWSLSRIKRQQSCQDGTYEHEGRQCCYCAAGQRLKQHCTAIADTVCEFCDDGSYNLHPNAKRTCEPCTSCSHPNAGLESVEACTIYKDAVCQCKAGHYCPTGGTCILCHTCDDCGGAEKINVSCSSAINTVCYEDKPQGGSNVAAVIVPIVIILLLAGLAIGVFYYINMKKNRAYRDKAGATRLTDDEGTEMTERRTEEMQLLKGVDLSCHLHNIAEEVGWRDMKRLALGSGISLAVIDSHEQNHLNDAVERTFELLAQWVEKQGSKAPETLVQELRKGDLNGKAEKVMEIIRKKAQAGNNQGS